MTVVASEIQLSSTKAFAAAVGFTLASQRETHRDEGERLYLNEARKYSTKPIDQGGSYSRDFRYYELTFKRPENDPSLAICQEKIAMNNDILETDQAIKDSLWGSKGPYDHHRLQKTGITFGAIFMGLGSLIELGALSLKIQAASQIASSQGSTTAATQASFDSAQIAIWVGLGFLLFGFTLFLVSLIFDILGNKKARPYNIDRASISNLHSAYITAIENMPSDRKLQKSDFDFDSYDAICQKYGRTRQVKIE